jgi:hypothetical protein
VENTDVTSVLKDAIGSVLEEVRKVPPVQTQNPTQHVIIQSADPPKPEPKMAWICATACIVMGLLSLVMVVMFLDLNRKYDRMQDYQNTTYMLVPEFRKLVDLELEKRKQEK